MIAKVIASLPPAERQRQDAIVYVGPETLGRVISNRVEYHGEPTVKWQKLQDSVYVNQYGERTVFPTGSDPGCGPGQDTGAFFRIHSPEGNSSMRFSGTRAVVTLPVKDEDIYYDDRREGTYIMLGGWGDNPQTAVDAGVYFNYDSDNWAGLIQVGGVPDEVPLTARFAPDQDLEIIFSVPEDDWVRLEVLGQLEDGRSVRLLENAPAEGWRSDGTGNIMKQETSIAQPKNQVDHSSGAYFRNVAWHEASLSDDFEQWEWSEDGETTAQTCSFPENNKVEVSGWEPYVDYSVSIDLW